MRRIGVFVGLTVLALALGPIDSAGAANSPTFRDCSLFVSGFDPDFVQISGVTVTPEGTLTVPLSQKQVPIEASESSDPGDNLAHVTLTVSVTAPHVPAQSLSGEATGRVELSAPLRKRKRGRSYTISWAATFDNGNHLCPSESTPENTTPKPFVVSID
ncbi:MAG: hypothetical protein E6G34_02200 [Actinobacteria bacterium]|nr:MAG: hypothetical protein E6G34_02200 [Actinomycetota bacterium]